MRKMSEEEKKRKIEIREREGGEEGGREREGERERGRKGGRERERFGGRKVMWSRGKKGAG